MAIVKNWGSPFCADHPHYKPKYRPKSNCRFCWRIWDDKQQKLIKELTRESVEYRAAARMNVDAVRGLIRALKEEDL